jgi:tRNA nucleotidyltransferase/poly(A) polymerase
MSPEPREREDYGDRQIEAARLVVIGGWVPDLLLSSAGERHIGSIDIDIALDASKLNDGRYADILKLLLETK